MTRRLLLASIVFACACGDDLPAASSDASVAGEGDAAAPDAGPVCPELEPGAGGGFEACNPVTQAGCGEGEKCTWLTTGETGCAPDGTVEIGGTCEDDDTSDDCAAGGLCIDAVCRTVCSINGDSCCSGFACSSYTSTFDDDTDENTGVCDRVCDPVAQDCADPAQGCYLQLSNGKPTCSRPAPTEGPLPTQGDQCVNDGVRCYLNGCAKGYGGFLFAGEGLPRDCTAFCTPVETYLVDPDGDGTGSLVAGADANGAAPHDCSEGRIGVPDHQCRFFQSYFIDMDSEYLDYISAAYGFCTPITGGFGDCTRYSEEWFLETYNDFIEGGGAPEDWGAEITALCDADPDRCANGCAEVATLEALDTAYCDAPANATRPACDAIGRRVVRRSLERHWAEQLVRAGMVSR